MFRLESRDRSPGESFGDPKPKSKYRKCTERVSPLLVLRLTWYVDLRLQRAEGFFPKGGGKPRLTPLVPGGSSSPAAWASVEEAFSAAPGWHRSGHGGDFQSLL